MGGGLYLSCDRTNNGKNCILDVQNNTFEANSARISGGAIYYDSIQPFGMQNNTFS